MPSATCTLTVIFEMTNHEHFRRGSVTEEHPEIAIRTTGPLTPESTRQLLKSVKTTYVLFTAQSHEVSDEFFDVLRQYENSEQPDIVEPYIFSGQLPNNPRWASQSTPYNYLKSTAIHGKIYRTDKLTHTLETFQELDTEALYIAYRLHWGINTVRPVNCGYSTHEELKSSKGLQIDTSTTTLLPNMQTESIELKLSIYRLLVLYLRGLREISATRIPQRHLESIVKRYQLSNLRTYSNKDHTIETAWIAWMSDKSYTSHLIKVLTEFDIYLRFESLSANAATQTNRFVTLSSIAFPEGTLQIGKEYRAKEQRDRSPTPDKYDFYNHRISEQSDILFFDRPSQADDNAEHLYRYFKRTYPEYKNTFFALHSRSNDWPRLQNEGFNLVEFYSQEFYNIFLRSDLVVSSQMFNLSRRGKDFTNSRFVYLQHGIQVNDMRTWISSKPFDIIVATGTREATYLKTIAPVETMNTGMPRLQNLKRDLGMQNTITYMPTWNFKYHNLSDESLASTDFIKSINQVLTNDKLKAFLGHQNLTLHVKLHPNLAQRSNLFKFTNIIINSPRSYRWLFTHSKLVFTDHSSAVLDAAYIGVPVAYYQPLKHNFYAEQVYSPGKDVKESTVGPIFASLPDLVDFLVSNKYEESKSHYGDRIDELFTGVDDTAICQRLIEAMLKL